MSDNDSLTSIDVKAPTLEKAIEQGLEKLGLSRNDVIIEIVEEGSRGVLGMGARDAVVRLTPLRPPTRPVEPPPPVSPGPAEEETEVTEPPEEVAEDVAPAPPEVPASSPTPPYVAPSTRTPTQEGREKEPPAQPKEPERTVEPKAEPAPTVHPPRVPEAEELADEARIGRAALDELLEHMDIDAEVDVYHAEPAPSEDEAPWILDVRGNDLGVLIGRHGETLNALQYVTRLIVSRELQRRANIVVDVEGYKARRETSLEKLAERMAEKAVQSGRTITLDPMPPNERRVIHVTLREDPRVETESVGTGDSRRVTIIPANSHQQGR